MQHLVAVQPHLTCGNQKGGNLHFGVAIVGNLKGNGAEIFQLKALAEDFSAHRIHRAWWFGMGDLHRRARLQIQLSIGLLGQTQLAG